MNHDATTRARLTRFEEQAEYEPAGHFGVLNRLLVGKALHGDTAVSVWLGELAPGGGADAHVHDGSEQIYVVLRGSVVVDAGDDVYDAGLHAAVHIPAGMPHAIRNTTQADAAVLVISSPALR